MKVSQCIILEILKDFSLKTWFSKNKAFQFEAIRLLDESHRPDNPSVLYVGMVDQYLQLDRSLLQDICVLCIGDREADLLSRVEDDGANVIFVQTPGSVATVVNRLYTGFYLFEKWCSDLDTAIKTGADYQTLFELGGRYFGGNAMIMVNSSYNVIGCNLKETPGHERIDYIIKNGYYTKEMTDELARMGYQANGARYMKPTILYPPNYMNCPLMVLSNHADNGIFLGFITIYFIESEPTPAQFEIFCYFAKKVQQYYTEKNQERLSAPTPLEMFMADLIKHTKEDESFLKDRARSLKIPLDASYRLCVIQWADFILPQADYIMNRLQSCLKFPFFRVILYHDSVLLLLQGDISSLKLIEEINESMGEFEDLLKICHGYAGFSTSGFSLMKINLAYQQAVTAGKYGSKLDPDKRIYFYSHYYIYEMLDDYQSRYKLEDMYVQKLRCLEKPSEENYDNLSLLRNYLLTERSISATAKIMHMHRNSVIYRLGKIQEILGLNLDDPDVRLRLLISFKIRELEAGHVQPVPALSKQADGTIHFYE